jgi:hypothetical protein
LLIGLAEFVLVVGRLCATIALETVGVDLMEFIFFATCLRHNFWVLK